MGHTESCKDAALKWAFAITTFGTAVFPLADFVSDIYVTHEFYTADDPAEQYWGKVSIGFLSISTCLSLAWFWVFMDVMNFDEADALWSSSFIVNALIGFVLTATNLRAQALACILLWKALVHKVDLEELKKGRDEGAGGGNEPSIKSLALIKLFEYFFETIPELLLQGYALLYMHYVNGADVVDVGNTVLIVSVSVSFATLISGMSTTFLWANDVAVIVVGGVYFLCITYGRMTLFALLFLQFGPYAIIFASAALLLRIVHVWRFGSGEDGNYYGFIFDSPTMCIVPVGCAPYDGGENPVRAFTHIQEEEQALASIVLYGPDALRILAMHVFEAAVGAVLLSTLGGRSIAPYVAGSSNGTATVSNVTGSATNVTGSAEIEVVVETGDVLWYIVWPYCAGLAALALLVVVDRCKNPPQGR